MFQAKGNSKLQEGRGGQPKILWKLWTGEWSQGGQCNLLNTQERHCHEVGGERGNERWGGDERCGDEVRR